MATKKQCDMHKAELDKLENEIDQMKADINSIKLRLDEILNKMKPITLKDKLTFALGILVYTVIISFNYSATDSRSINNEKRIDKIDSKIDKIYDLTYQTNQDVAVLKSKSK